MDYKSPNALILVLIFFMTTASAFTHAQSRETNKVIMDSYLQDSECTPPFPSLRVRAGDEVVVLRATVLDPDAQSSLTEPESHFAKVIFPAYGSSNTEQVRHVPFQAIKEAIYISDVDVLENVKGESSAEIKTSMFAVGFGGNFLVENQQDSYAVSIKYREAFLDEMKELSIKGADGKTYTVQRPKIVSVNESVAYTMDKKQGRHKELFPAAGNRKLLVESCSYVVPRRVF